MCVFLTTRQEHLLVTNKPVQLGFGSKGGCEATVHSARTFLLNDDGEVLLKEVDVKNAFNSVDRGALLIFITLSNFTAARYCGNGQNQPPHNHEPRLDHADNANEVNVDPALQQNQEGQVPAKRRSGCCPYDFDSRICRVLDDRVLCGFDRNYGSPQSKDHALELSHGCRIRNGRLECGYVQGPFTNPRRPPPEDHIVHDQYDMDGGGDLDMNNSDHLINSNESVIKLVLKKTKQSPAQKPTPAMHKKHRPVTKCLEINDRIVCRQLA